MNIDSADAAEYLAKVTALHFPDIGRLTERELELQ